MGAQAEILDDTCYGMAGNDFSALGQGGVAVVILHEAAAYGLVSAEEGKSHRAGDDGTVLWAVFAENIGGGAALDGRKAEGLKELLTEDEGILVGSTLAGGVTLDAVGGDVVARKAVEHSGILHFGQSADAVAECRETGDGPEGEALIRGETGGVSIGESIGKGPRILNGLGVVGEPHRSHQ